MPIQVSLLSLFAEDTLYEEWPEELRNQLEDIEKTAGGKPPKSDVAPEVVDENAENEKPKHVTDRDALAVMGDWLDDKLSEPWLAKACRFIAKRPDIRIVQTHSGYSWYWKFEGMPDGWKYLRILGSMARVAGLLASLALEIKKRTEEME